MSAPRTQPMTATYPAPWKSTNAVKASNFGSVAARVTSLTSDPANPGHMTQVTIAKVFGGLQDDPETAKELAAFIVEAVNNHELLQQKLEFAEFEWNRATEGMQERDATIASLKARIQELIEALTLAEDVLSRRPFSAGIWPNGMHPQEGIEKIRAPLQPKDSAK